MQGLHADEFTKNSGNSAVGNRRILVRQAKPGEGGRMER